MFNLSSSYVPHNKTTLEIFLRVQSTQAAKKSTFCTHIKPPDRLQRFCLINFFCFLSPPNNLTTRAPGADYNYQYGSLRNRIFRSFTFHPLPCEFSPFFTFNLPGQSGFGLAKFHNNTRFNASTVLRSCDSCSLRGNLLPK